MVVPVHSESIFAAPFSLATSSNLSDGENSVLDIAERSGIAFDVIHAIACDLERCGLLKCLY